ncbi:tRNA (adenine(22)-N(1))-methyltransferase TrmK [Halobacillus sp. Cin3]|uniref:tRNA (adenine(22)-N(1))-methyltransferase n=1 Tax=Halobacillus sp. Cin3 TaxID=2928441 RepID=UPI00248F3354|nr:tRNA (adenine(22)-N(1))-methyltransferase TrmK [Halobacillus sp. Cin3]
MNVHQLSERLAKVAEYLPAGAVFADIGSDHAYLPCYVCLKDPQAQAIAGEVNQGPYDSALNEVKAHDLQSRIDVRLGDGLEVIQPGEVKQVTIAGMGGPLIRDILERGRDKLTAVNRIIAQPNIDARSIRQWFYTHGYSLIDEQIMEEGGHIYEILAAEKGDPASAYESADLEKELWLGPYLMKEKAAAFRKKWREEMIKKEYILDQMQKAATVDAVKVDTLQKEIKWLQEVLSQ